MDLAGLRVVPANTTAQMPQGRGSCPSLQKAVPLDQVRFDFPAFVTARAARTKHCRLGDLSHSKLFLTEAGKSKMKEPADSVLGEDPRPDLSTAGFYVSSHSLSLVCV